MRIIINQTDPAANTVYNGFKLSKSKMVPAWIPLNEGQFMQVVLVPESEVDAVIAQIKEFGIEMLSVRELKI